MKGSPAYGARNAQMVATGTGEALPGPVALRGGPRSDVPYNRPNREVGNEPGGRRRRP